MEISRPNPQNPSTSTQVNSPISSPQPVVQPPPVVQPIPMAQPQAQPAPRMSTDIRIDSSLIYKGEFNDPNPKDYIANLQMYARANNWDLATSKQRLWLYLQGNGYPHDWKIKNQDWIFDAATTWQQICDKFITDLNPTMGYDQDITILTGSYQQQGEPLLIYLNRMKALYRKVLGILSEAQAVSITIDNVHPNFRPHLQLYGATTFTEVEQRFRKVERYFLSNPYAKAQGNALPVGQFSYYGASGPTAEFNFITPGHSLPVYTGLESPPVVKECRYCHRKGHIIAECNTRMRAEAWKQNMSQNQGHRNYFPGNRGNNNYQGNRGNYQGNNKRNSNFFPDHPNYDPGNQQWNPRRPQYPNQNEANQNWNEPPTGHLQTLEFNNRGRTPSPHRQQSENFQRGSEVNPQNQ